MPQVSQHASECCFWNPSLFFSFFIIFHILSLPPLPFSLSVSWTHKSIYKQRKFPIDDWHKHFFLSFAMCFHPYDVFNYYNPTQRPVFLSLLPLTGERNTWNMSIEELRIKTGYSFIDLINDYLLHTTLCQKLCQALGTQYLIIWASHYPPWSLQSVKENRCFKKWAPKVQDV